MNSDYVWTFNEAAFGSDINGPFSLEYHLPKQRLTVAPSELIGSRLWIVIKNNGGSFLFAALIPSAIEVYKEGKYKGDLLVSSSEFSSVRFLPREDSRGPWRLDSFISEEDIRECTAEEKALFVDTLNKNRKIGFAPPARTVLESVPKTGFFDLEHAVPDQLAAVLRTVSLGDVSIIKSLPESLSALGGVAFTILKSIRSELSESDVVKLLTVLDPVKTIDGLSMHEHDEKIMTLASLPPVVDTFLEEMDIDKISPRTFLTKILTPSSDWIDKTNDAEEAHENVLKDLALRLKERGFRIYKSRSFDLFAEKSSTRLLWEVKSANGVNTVAQGEKGVIQLLRYSTALSSERFAGTRFLLLLQDSKQPAVQRYLSVISARAGAELWLHDTRKDWPNRVNSIDSQVFPDL